MMAGAEQHQIVEPGFTSFSPMHYVVAFNIAILRATGKLAMAIAANEGASCSGRYRSGLAAHA